jgi:ribosomal protein S18 acetylase RimI-like enzyme
MSGGGMKRKSERILRFVELMLPEWNIQPGEFWVKTVEQEEAEIERYARSENSLFLVALKDEKIVGTLTLTGRGVEKNALRQSDKHVVVLGLSVLPEYRGEGIGSFLLQSALTQAHRGGVIKKIKVLSYMTNERARRFFSSHGFKIEGKLQNEIYRDGEYIDVFTMATYLGLPACEH